MAYIATSVYTLNSCVIPQITADNYDFWVNHVIQSILPFWMLLVGWVLIGEVGGILVFLLLASIGDSDKDTVRWIFWIAIGSGLLGAVLNYSCQPDLNEMLLLQQIGYKNANPQQIIDLQNAVKSC